MLPIIPFGNSKFKASYSARTRGGANASFRRTVAATTNRRKFAIATVFKLGIPGSSGLILWSAYTGSQDFCNAQINNSGAFAFRAAVANVSICSTDSALKFLDPSAHYFALVNFDSTAAVATDRVKLEMNGVTVSLAANAPPVLDWPALNQDTYMNFATALMGFGYEPSYAHGNDGLHSATLFFDGVNKASSDFGSINANGVFVLKPYVGGALGTNGGRYLFEDATAATAGALGKDTGNANNLTPSNVSVAADATFDRLTDGPTENFATLDPLQPGATGITWAGLRSGTTAVRATQPVDGLAVYWEVTAGGSNVTAGVISTTGTTTTTTVTANKTFGFRIDAAGQLDYRNVTDAGAWTGIGTASGEVWPYGTGAQADWNFGQRPWAGAAPSGYGPVSTRSRISSVVKTSGSFTGNANADGVTIWCNGTPATLTINGNAVTFGTHAQKLAGGFKLRTSSSAYNAAGTNNWVATAGAPFVGPDKTPNNAQVY